MGLIVTLILLWLGCNLVGLILWCIAVEIIESTHHTLHELKERIIRGMSKM